MTLRQVVFKLLKQKFPPLTTETRDAIHAKSADELESIVDRVLDAASLRELGL